jgi:hypothetical protein
MKKTEQMGEYFMSQNDGLKKREGQAWYPWLTCDLWLCAVLIFWEDNYKKNVIKLDP